MHALMNPWYPVRDLGEISEGDLLYWVGPSGHDPRKVEPGERDLQRALTVRPGRVAYEYVALPGADPIQYYVGSDAGPGFPASRFGQARGQQLYRFAQENPCYGLHWHQGQPFTPPAGLFEATHGGRMNPRPPVTGPYSVEVVDTLNDRYVQRLRGGTTLRQAGKVFTKMKKKYAYAPQRYVVQIVGQYMGQPSVVKAWGAGSNKNPNGQHIWEEGHGVLGFNNPGHYEERDLGYGIEITAPDGQSVFLQDDDAQMLREQISDIEIVWDQTMGGPVGPFNTFEDHLDAVLSQYFVRNNPFRLTKADKRVVQAFVKRQPASSKKLTTDGWQLDGNWMGGRGIAFHERDVPFPRVLIRDLGSRAVQTVQRYLGKLTPTSYENPPYTVDTWFERDRSFVGIEDQGTGKSIAEWWDEDVHELVDAGFLDPRDYESSAIEYAQHLGVLPAGLEWTRLGWENPRGPVVYEVTLGPLEEVRPYAGDYMLVRFGRPVVSFKPSKAQLRKIKKGRGKLRISGPQIVERFKYFNPPLQVIAGRFLTDQAVRGRPRLGGFYGGYYVVDVSRGKPISGPFGDVRRADAELARLVGAPGAQYWHANPNDFDWEDFAEGAAKAFWAEAYIREIEEQEAPQLGPGMGGEWYDVLPPTPPAAERDGAAFAMAVRQAWSPAALQQAVELIGDDDTIGHYAAMKAMGHGVGPADYGADLAHKQTPYWEPSVDTTNAAYDAVQAEANPFFSPPAVQHLARPSTYMATMGWL